MKRIIYIQHAALSSLFIASIGLLIYINKKETSFLLNCGSPTNRNIEGLNNIKVMKQDVHFT